MPELPEVETIKRGLSKKIINKKISNFDCDWSKMINYSLKVYKKKVKNLIVKKVSRRAKMIIINLNSNNNILVHLKMTGQLVFKDRKDCLVGGHPIQGTCQELPNKFTHASFEFTDKTTLYFNDVRKFGWVRLLTDQELKDYFNHLELGPEPLSSKFTQEYFLHKLKSKPRSKIKQFLLNPQNLVGIGNIYADEICYYAKVRPTRLVKNLTKKQIDLLFTGLKKILEQAIIAQGTTFSDYVNADGNKGTYTDKLQVYGRTDLPCYQCKTIINKIKLGGRGTTFCPECQK